MNEKTRVKKILNSNQLKLIAIAAMTIDHLTWAFCPGYQKVWWVICLHIIGRLTAPIMWFFIAEGCFYTHNKRKYLTRLFGFAVISHFAYDFAFGIPFFDISYGLLNRTSVMWSLFLAAAVIFVTKSDKVPDVCKYVFLFGACVLALPSDWSSIAVMAPVFIYEHRGNFKRQAIDIVLWTAIYAVVYFFAMDKVYGLLQMFTFLTIPLLFMYNGKRGRNPEINKVMKWLFYIYYPAHLVVIGIIRIMMNGNIAVIA